MKKSTLCKMLSTLLIAIFTFGQFNVMASAAPVDTSGYTIQVEAYSTNEQSAGVGFYDYINTIEFALGYGGASFVFNAWLEDEQGNNISSEIQYMLFRFNDETRDPIISSTGIFSDEPIWDSYWARQPYDAFTVIARLPDGSFVSRTFNVMIFIIAPK